MVASPRQMAELGSKSAAADLNSVRFRHFRVTNAVRSVADGRFIAPSSGFSPAVKPKGLILPSCPQPGL